MKTACLSMITAVFFLLVGATAFAQREPGGDRAPVTQNDTLAATRPAPAYNSENRPDPFLAPRPAVKGPDGSPVPPGLAGKRIDEVQLEGVSLWNNEPIAILVGTDGKGYFAREGARLRNGTVEHIDFAARSVAFLQVLDDPTAWPRTRTVVLRLHP